jgi:hypothetical protein
MSPVATVKHKVKNYWFWAKHPGAALMLLFATAPRARAQTAGTVETNTVQMIQYGVDIIVALSGCFAVYLGFRAARTLVASSREGGRGDNKGHHVMTDLVGAVIAVSIGTIIYIVSNQFFAGATGAPTLSAPSITPTTN